MKRLLLLAALFAFAAAMVPRARRAVNTEDDPQPSTSSTNKPICAKHTPCGWAFYKQFGNIVEPHETNTYCQCDVDKTCQIDEDDVTAMSYIKRCKPPSQEVDETTES